MSVSKGIITIGQGAQKYIDMSIQLAMSIKIHSPGLSLTLVTDSKDTSLRKYFDHIVPINSDYGVGLKQKIHIYEYSPYDETIFVDADCFIVRPFEFLFDEFKNETVSAIGHKMTKGSWAGFEASEMMGKLQLKYIISLNGGVYYFKKSELGGKIFDKAAELLLQYDDLGIGTLRGQYNEEPLMSLAMSSFNQNPIDDKGKGMRTPIGITGQLKLDVLTGVCGFYKHGVWVEPAIMHFGGDCTKTYFYKRELRKIQINSLNVLPKKVTSLVVNILYNIPYAVHVFVYRVLKRLIKGTKFKMTPIIPMFRFE